MLTRRQLSEQSVYAAATLSPHNGGLRYPAIEQRWTAEAAAEAVLAQRNAAMLQDWAWEQALVQCLPATTPFGVCPWQWAEDLGFVCQVRGGAQ